MGNVIKSVSKAEFKKQEKEAFEPRYCPMCKKGTEIIIDLPVIAPKSITIRCKHCDYSVTKTMRLEYFSSDGKFGTFVTAESFTKSLFEVVDKWNAKYEVTANA